MRIAFVGKGGSGKTTLSTSFTSYAKEHIEKQMAFFDADLNIHGPNLLGFEDLPLEKHISNPKVSSIIKKWLVNKNDTVANLSTFRKTTPPTRKSNIIKIESFKTTPLHDFCYSKDNLSIFVVGTYQNEDIGASCYHNNLADLEIILNHLDDKEGLVIVDMVAGVDSFAGTLHSQFDLVCFIVEPTKRSLEVFKQYESLSKESETESILFVIGNKIRSEQDKQFIYENIDKEKVLGFFFEDEHIRKNDQEGGQIDVNKLSEQNYKLLETIYIKLKGCPDSRNTRLIKIHKLHKKYINQSFIKDRFGDLSNQIDSDFKFE